MNLKKVIIALIISIIILLIILLLILGINNKNTSNNEEIYRPITNEEYKEYINSKEFGKIVKLKDSTTFFTVISCIDKYMGYNLQKDSEKIYNVLSKEYIEQYNITKENVLKEIKVYNNGETFSAEQIYEYNNNESISTYFVYGKTIEDTFNNDNPKTEELNIVVQLDKVNRTFYIILNEKVDDSNIGTNKQIAKIKNNIVNEYTTPKNAENQLGMIYLNNYKEKLLNDVNKAYALLDEEYKEKRYNTIEEFKKYIASINVLPYITSANCELDMQGENKIFKLKDQYGNTYIFKETAIMEYTVMLDDYTLETETFKQKYEKALDKEKGHMNIEKFFEMINMRDYTSAYSLLDENFKQNNFKTVADFEKYMQTKTYRYNKVNYKTYTNQISSIYIYTIGLTDRTGEKSEEIEFNIVMKLLEGTDFVMSFTVK